MHGSMTEAERPIRRSPRFCASSLEIGLHKPNMVVASMASHNSVRDADGVEGGNGNGDAQASHTIDRRMGQGLSRKRDRTREMYTRCTGDVVNFA